jgi:hypothetical protein
LENLPVKVKNRTALHISSVTHEYDEWVLVGINNIDIVVQDYIYKDTVLRS